MRLQTPSEQSKLLGNVPTVIPDVNELNSNSGDIINDMNFDKGSPKSILQCNASVPSYGWQDEKASEEKTHDGNASPQERKQLISVPREPQHSQTPNSELEHDNITSRRPLQLTAEMKKNKSEAEDSVICSQEMPDKEATRKGLEALRLQR